MKCAQTKAGMADPAQYAVVCTIKAMDAVMAKIAARLTPELINHYTAEDVVGGITNARGVAVLGQLRTFAKQMPCVRQLARELHAKVGDSSA